MAHHIVYYLLETCFVNYVYIVVHIFHLRRVGSEMTRIISKGQRWMNEFPSNAGVLSRRHICACMKTYNAA